MTLVPQTKISIPLTHDEFIALSSAATRELRTPRDQARFLLRQILLGPDATDPTPDATQPEPATVLAQ